MKICDEIVTKNIADNIQYYRKARKLTQEQLSKLLNVSRTSISCWENGSRIPQITDLVQLSYIFKISIEQLVYKSDQICFYGRKNMDLSDAAVSKLLSRQDADFFNDVGIGEEGALHTDTFYVEHMAKTISCVIENDRLVNLLSDFFYINKVNSITSEEDDLPLHLNKYIACIETSDFHFLDIDIQQLLLIEIAKELKNIKKEIAYGKNKSGKKQRRKDN